MDIKILDSWLREHLETKAKPKDIAKALSLTSASVEKIEEFNGDYLYHIEITTNRVDMVSVIGVAREAAAVLPQFGFDAAFKTNTFIESNDEVISSRKRAIERTTHQPKQTIDIVNDDRLVKRITCVVLEVTKKESPEFVKKRLESADVRSLNNLIDVTNYVMLEIGHPTHAFDYDRLTIKKLTIRPAKKGEKITTLDKKQHTLLGGDIVADNGNGVIVDLLGVMGTENSVVTEETKRVLFFIDNNDPVQIRKTSMSLGIRTDAASINEKDVDPELAPVALLRGIALYKEIADAKIVSDIIDIYPKKWKSKTISVSEEKIRQVIGVEISIQQAKDMLEQLHFGVKREEDTLHVTIPSYRDADMSIAEDVIEEIARMYGYHNLPSKLPPSEEITPHHFTNTFYWEQRAKDALKYWNFTEIYTYSMVAETLLTVPANQAIKLKNPLDEYHAYMRQSLIPSLREAVMENKRRETVKVFEIANVYHKKTRGLPDEVRMLSGIVKGPNETFFTVKGIVEQLTTTLGISNLSFKELSKKGIGADVFIDKNPIGEIQILEDDLISFELNFAEITRHATLRKTYTPIAKYPPVIEDLAFVLNPEIKTGDVIEEIKKQNPLIAEVSLLDQYENKRTFHILYQDPEKNLTNEEVTTIREKILTAVSKKFAIK